MTDISTDATTAIPEFPMTRAPGCPFAPPQESLALNANAQLSRVRIWDGSTPWLITGYEAIRALFSDARASVDDRLPGYPHWNEGMLATVHTRPRSVFTSDAEEHTRFRRMLSKPFTFRRVEALRPAVQHITDDHIDALLAGPQPGDIVSKLALPVPSLVISQLLGVPYEDADFFQKQAHRGMGRYATAEDTAQGAASLAKYLANLVRVKMTAPSEDLVSDLAERVNSEELSVREAAQLATGVLIAGHETTANMISLSVAALLAHPDQLALLRDAEDPKVIATAVEELMRYLSIIQTGQRRIAIEDIEVGGETIRAGEGIILDVAPANWDTRQFPEPDRLDLRRDDGPHVGFGYGRHQCVGQQLARMELQIVLPTLFRRIPTLQLAVPVEQLPFKHDSLAYGVYELPVTW
ncbi:cytochrome P450 [Mycobacterium kubicae]|uniref:Cytochrome P450 n=1 Tax=Mycobacterium kubicae TaxID=120959 RepID=A0AAX1JG96_9MYCO|nr:cytochrome P450 [Mycobacterium kubicae]MCV7095840.1 cytochrome P450 [Mycobacterium kubicae]OBK56426.1 cytochrome [Mycobacterium kubicae]ORV99518.1 cytochrome [Mycobacterium kubicae]QNI12020.1 cytochrome P450 [Mycobacterium kubicae]QPI40247.1 cytochrome P450 [Mycobacterium kubicae]